MRTDYKHKYIECIKIYHELHAELSGLTVKLNTKMNGFPLPAGVKLSIKDTIEESASKIRETDLKFRNIVSK